MNLSDITKINFGSAGISAVYNGGIKLWPKGAEVSNKVMKFTVVSGDTWDKTGISAYTADNRLVEPVSKDTTGWTYDEDVEFLQCNGSPSANLLTFEGFPKMVKFKNAADLFNGCSSCTDISTGNMDFSECWSMYRMFTGCNSLTSLDLSKFDTSKVSVMANIFVGCHSLTSLDVSNFNTSLVRDMSLMFNGCSKLASLDLSNWDTSNVTEMTSMLAWCKSLTTLNLSNFNTSLVTNMSAMFNECSKLASLDLSNWDTSNVTNMSYMFNNCSALTTVKMTNCSQDTKDKIRAALDAAGLTSAVITDDTPVAPARAARKRQTKTKTN